MCAANFEAPFCLTGIEIEIEVFTAEEFTFHYRLIFYGLPKFTRGWCLSPRDFNLAGFAGIQAVGSLGRRLRRYGSLVLKRRLRGRLSGRLRVADLARLMGEASLSAQLVLPPKVAEAAI